MRAPADNPAVQSITTLTGTPAASSSWFGMRKRWRPAFTAMWARAADWEAIATAYLGRDVIASPAIVIEPH